MCFFVTLEWILMSQCVSQFCIWNTLLFLFNPRHNKTCELAQASVYAGLRAWQQRLYQWGLHRVDAHSCSANVSQALSSHWKEEQLSAYLTGWKILFGYCIQYPLKSGLSWIMQINICKLSDGTSLSSYHLSKEMVLSCGWKLALRPR